MIIDNRFNLSQEVYLKTDEHQLKRIVTAIVVCPDNSYLYEPICGTIQSRHYDFEISTEIDVQMKINS